MESNLGPGPHGDGGHRTRELLSIVAAVAGGLGLLGFVIAAIGSVGPGRATWLWVVSALLVAVWLTGTWWRFDAPDRRTNHHERERRGF